MPFTKLILLLLSLSAAIQAAPAPQVQPDKLVRVHARLMATQLILESRALPSQQELQAALKGKSGEVLRAECSEMTKRIAADIGMVIPSILRRAWGHADLAEHLLLDDQEKKYEDVMHWADAKDAAYLRKSLNAKCVKIRTALAQNKP